MVFFHSAELPLLCHKARTSMRDKILQIFLNRTYVSHPIILPFLPHLLPLCIRLPQSLPIATNNVYHTTFSLFNINILYIFNTYHDMTLRRKIINFCRLYCTNDFDQTTGVCHVTVMQLHFTLPMAFRILVKMLNTRSIKRTGSSNDTMHVVSFL